MVEKDEKPSDKWTIPPIYTQTRASEWLAAVKKPTGNGNEHQERSVRVFRFAISSMVYTNF